jgi:DNA-binding transcriptional ArsR family regulator
MSLCRQRATCTARRVFAEPYERDGVIGRTPSANYAAITALSGATVAAHVRNPSTIGYLDSSRSVRADLPFVATYRAGDAWEALGDPSRRAIVERLAEQPRAVGELAADLPISRPAVSQHLRVLKDAGLVTERAAGTRRIYRLNPIGVSALRDQLDAFWARALATYKDVADHPTEENP